MITVNGKKIAEVLYTPVRASDFNDSVKESNCKHVETVEVIKVTVVEGSGEEDSPFKEVTQYWSKDGKLLFKES